METQIEPHDPFINQIVVSVVIIKLMSQVNLNDENQDGLLHTLYSHNHAFIMRTVFQCLCIFLHLLFAKLMLINTALGHLFHQ